MVTGGMTVVVVGVVAVVVVLLGSHQAVVDVEPVAGQVVVLGVVDGVEVPPSLQLGHVVLDSCPWSPPPVSTLVVRVGAAGVTGVGGGVQSPPAGSSSLRRPNTRLSARSSGKGSRQHRLLKSSRSTVHATAPPKPMFFTNRAWNHSKIELSMLTSAG